MVLSFLMSEIFLRKQQYFSQSRKHADTADTRGRAPRSVGEGVRKHCISRQRGEVAETL